MSVICQKWHSRHPSVFPSVNVTEMSVLYNKNDVLPVMQVALKSLQQSRNRRQATSQKQPLKQLLSNPKQHNGGSLAQPSSRGHNCSTINWNYLSPAGIPIVWNQHIGTKMNRPLHLNHRFQCFIYALCIRCIEYKQQSDTLISMGHCTW